MLKLIEEDLKNVPETKSVVIFKKVFAKLKLASSEGRELDIVKEFVKDLKNVEI